MQNFFLPFVPERALKPRNKGLTMMMDKGLSPEEVKNFLAMSAEYTDVVKFGFGTSVFSPMIKEKIALYKQAGVKPFFGGTCFEAFIVRGMFEEYIEFVEKYGIDLCEVSDGSMEMPHKDKLRYIEILSKKFTVISEVGSKSADVEIPIEKWTDMMNKELAAGSWKVIGEARESGTIGLYNKDGSVNNCLIEKICSDVNVDDVMWETPDKKQQAYFIKMLGSDVNLGNIAANEVIALEALRLGLRGDTFFDFLPDDIEKK